MSYWIVRWKQEESEVSQVTYKGIPWKLVLKESHKVQFSVSAAMNYWLWMFLHWKILQFHQICYGKTEKTLRTGFEWNWLKYE